MTDERVRYQRERRVLQALVGSTVVFPLLLGGIIALSGLAGMELLFGVEMARPLDPSLDSNVRFLGSNFFGMGLLVLWVIPKIESRLTPYRIFVATALIGASARVLSHVFVGRPVPMVEALIAVEASILVFGLWQTRIHRLHKQLPSP